MHNVLTDSLIRVDGNDGRRRMLSLPEVFEVMVADDVASFPTLRPHQRHAWHAFLAQLAVLALVKAGRKNVPRREDEWRDMLRHLTPGFQRDEPWCLVVADPSKPAFMQCPATGGLSAYKKRRTTPDDLDLLVTAKNHDVKASIASNGLVDDWLFALINLQTMSGFLGAGNYGIARMNGGFSSRPCLGLAPADGGVGAHLLHDIQRMIESRDHIIEKYAPDYFRADDGGGLLWLEPWDGTESLRLDQLDPYFIEICRRVRLERRDGRIFALCGTSKKPRIAAREANGNVGDHWAPISRSGKALSLSGTGFRYDRLHKLVLDDGEFSLPRAMRVDASSAASWRLVARGVGAGQGKTEGYHERTDIVFGPRVARSLMGFGDQRDTLASLANAQLEEIKEVLAALRFAIAIAASGGKDATSIGQSDRQRAHPYLRWMDTFADSHFFDCLQSRFEASEAARPEVRRIFARLLIDRARALLEEATEAVPCATIHRFRARARATSAFWGRLRRADSVFSNQEGIFETSHLEEDERAR